MRWQVGVAVAVLATCVACGSGRADDPGEAVDELARHDGMVCPEELPKDPDDELGFGTEDAADRTPNQGSISAAWVCVYGLDDGRGVWTRGVDPVDVSSDDLDRVGDAIESLQTDSPQDCTSDLGPRYVVVAVREGKDLTGYAVDDYGCESVRITDDPFETVPGEAEQAGTVTGTLHGSEDLLALAKKTLRTS